MSPYRVIVSDLEHPEVRAVLCAMMSKDKATGDPVIYIIQKMNLDIVDKVGGVDYEAIAYKLSSKWNSTIVGTYRIIKESNRKYRVLKVGDKFTYDLGFDKFTQSACLQAAMNHFCQIHALTIDTVL